MTDDAFDELTRLSNLALRIQRRRIGNRDDMIDKFSALEEKIRAKIDKLSEEDLKASKEEAKQDQVAP